MAEIDIFDDKEDIFLCSVPLADAGAPNQVLSFPSSREDKITTSEIESDEEIDTFIASSQSPIRDFVPSYANSNALTNYCSSKSTAKMEGSDPISEDLALPHSNKHHWNAADDENLDTDMDVFTQQTQEFEPLSLEMPSTQDFENEIHAATLSSCHSNRPIEGSECKLIYENALPISQPKQFDSSSSSVNDRLELSPNFQSKSDDQIQPTDSIKLQSDLNETLITQRPEPLSLEMPLTQDFEAEIEDVALCNDSLVFTDEKPNSESNLVKCSIAMEPNKFLSNLKESLPSPGSDATLPYDLDDDVLESQDKNQPDKENPRDSTFAEIEFPSFSCPASPPLDFGEPSQNYHHLIKSPSATSRFQTVFQDQSLFKNIETDVDSLDAYNSKKSKGNLDGALSPDPQSQRNVRFDKEDFGAPTQLPSFIKPRSVPKTNVHFDEEDYDAPTQLPTFIKPSSVPKTNVPFDVEDYDAPTQLLTFIKPSSVPKTNVPFDEDYDAPTQLPTNLKPSPVSKTNVPFDEDYDAPTQLPTNLKPSPVSKTDVAFDKEDYDAPTQLPTNIKPSPVSKTDVAFDKEDYDAPTQLPTYIKPSPVSKTDVTFDKEDYDAPTQLPTNIMPSPVSKADVAFHKEDYDAPTQLPTYIKPSPVSKTGVAFHKEYYDAPTQLPTNIKPSPVSKTDVAFDKEDYDVLTQLPTLIDEPIPVGRSQQQFIPVKEYNGVDKTYLQKRTKTKQLSWEDDYNALTQVTPSVKLSVDNADYSQQSDENSSETQSYSFSNINEANDNSPIKNDVSCAISLHSGRENDLNVPSQCSHRKKNSESNSKSSKCLLKSCFNVHTEILPLTNSPRLVNKFNKNLPCNLENSFNAPTQCSSIKCTGEKEEVQNPSFDADDNAPIQILSSSKATETIEKRKKSLAINEISNNNFDDSSTDSEIDLVSAGLEKYPESHGRSEFSGALPPPPDDFDDARPNIEKFTTVSNGNDNSFFMVTEVDSQPMYFSSMKNTNNHVQDRSTNESEKQSRGSLNVKFPILSDSDDRSIELPTTPEFERQIEEAERELLRNSKRPIRRRKATWKMNELLNNISNLSSRSSPSQSVCTPETESRRDASQKPVVRFKRKRTNIIFDSESENSLLSQHTIDSPNNSCNGIENRARRRKKFLDSQPQSSRSLVECQRTNSVSQSCSCQARQTRRSTKISEGCANCRKIQNVISLSGNNAYKTETSSNGRKRRGRIIRSENEDEENVQNGYRVAFAILPSLSFRSIVVDELNGYVVDVVDANIFVCDKFKRTIKILSALCLGIPVVTSWWLLDSQKQNKWLDPSSYILKDRNAETQWQFSLRNCIEKAKISKLLSGYHVLTTQGVTPRSTEIHKLVKCSGGTNLSKMPRVWPAKSFIISCRRDEAQWITQRVPHVIDVQFFFNAILRQNLDFTQRTLK